MIKLGELDNFKKQMFYFFPFFKVECDKRTCSIVSATAKKGLTGYVDLEQRMNASKEHIY